MDFDAVKKLASLPTDTLPLCLAGELVGEIADLERQLAATPAASNVGESPRRVIAEQIAELRERMQESTVDFRLRAMPSKVWTRFWSNMPVRGEKESHAEWSERVHPIYTELVSRTCVDPQMTVEQVDELSGLLHGSAWIRLTNACIAINAGEVNVPNFSAASDLTGSSEQT